MKISTLIAIILIILVLSSVVYYFTKPKDKCVNVNCSIDQTCDKDTGKCEVRVQTSQTPMDQIERAIDNKLNSENTSQLNGIDKIEQAINNKLNG